MSDLMTHLTQLFGVESERMKMDNFLFAGITTGTLAYLAISAMRIRQELRMILRLLDERLPKEPR